MRKNRLRNALLACALPSLACAAPWNFDEALDVTAAQGAKIFHHLEAAGRKSVAAHDGTVAVVWEDNRDGTPHCYVAFKSATDAKFGNERLLSEKGECYEPAVAALDGGRFVAVWEEASRTHARIVSAAGAGDPVALGEQESSQATVGVDGTLAYDA